VVLPLDAGFETDNLAVISETDILGDRLARPRKKRRARQLPGRGLGPDAGDLVVHIDHGIGRYEGLKTLDVQGAPHDCLELQYGGEAKLYLPVENIDLLTRYGADSEGVQLDRLGGAAWQARKAKAKERLREMAEGLIRIAAAAPPSRPTRSSRRRGCSTSSAPASPTRRPTTSWPPSAMCWRTWAPGKPMDRLICGDVGFGKTEVALRAAFVVAMSGQQVAIVCPTTLLARQHFKTFRSASRAGRSRCAACRAWSPPRRPPRPARPGQRRDRDRRRHPRGAVQAGRLQGPRPGDRRRGAALRGQAQGEAQGASRRRAHADPDRHADPAHPADGAVGIREMSIIATPPVDRLAVRTYITPWDPVTLREALLREKYRGGQAYYVVPRLKDLPELERFLREQVPEVKFVVGHGQMAPTQLEEVMSAFYDGQYDVLLSTTIVESGLDIPTANTLIIHRADMFGLAQLYQLRGRVGRAKARAYAYLTTPAEKQITLSAEKRLKVLQSLDSLGAGFQLASHDLDIAAAATCWATSSRATSARSASSCTSRCWRTPSRAARAAGGGDLSTAAGRRRSTPAPPC
jgi:transcription-repair coupling factor (superfamily II helicase)